LNSQSLFGLARIESFACYALGKSVLKKDSKREITQPAGGGDCKHSDQSLEALSILLTWYLLGIVDCLVDSLELILMERSLAPAGFAFRCPPTLTHP
jgi:hypothetical protein